MKLVSYTTGKDKAPKVGAIGDGETVVDLSALAGDMISLIEGGAAALDKARNILSGGAQGLPLASVTLLAPIPRPRKNVFCVGWNYLDHFNEGAKASPQARELPDHPTFFTKAPTTMNGPYADVPAHPNATQTLDWEVEMAMVIGKGGINISEADAMSHVFGYMVANDVSARETQRKHGHQWFKGKSLDGHLPMGPWLTTADAVADPNKLALSCKVNGVLKQNSSTEHLYFKLPRIIAELSQGLTLEPGDVILTGTPSGVGHARTPPEFMKPGDVMETEVEGLGTLRNTIVA